MSKSIPGELNVSKESVEYYKLKPKSNNFPMRQESILATRV